MGSLVQTLKRSILCFVGFSSLAQAGEFIPKYSYPQSQPLKIDSRLLGQCLAYQTLLSETPYHFNRNFPDSDQAFSAFIEYLGASRNRKFDFSTGQENILRSWVLQQPQNSIDPVAIYLESLKLNKGNIFDAVLTVHQLLRNEARYFSNRYQYQSTSEAYNLFFDHFIDIRGDLIERGPGFYGDHAGTWYRIWGTMLYQMLWMPSSITQGQFLGLKQKIVGSIGNDIGVVLSNYVELSKFMAQVPVDWKGKIAANKAGGDVAEVLMKTLWAKKSGVNSEHQALCDNRKYLVPVPQKTIEKNELLANAVPQVDLISQMSPTLKQQGGTCYAYSFTAAVEAALYRKDQIHRQMSPDFMFTRIFANRPQDSVRLFMTTLGQSYADGQIGANGSDMFDLLGESLFNNGTYVNDEDFREAYETMTKNLPKHSIMEIIKFSLKPNQSQQPNMLRQYGEMASWGHVLENLDVPIKLLSIEKVWISGNHNEDGVLPALSTLLRKNIPPIVSFYYDHDRVQVSDNGGKNWSAPKDFLFARPIWHAVVLQKVEKARDGQVYLIFRDSNKKGTAENPALSQIRMRVEDAPTLINQILAVKGPWDR